MRLVRFGFLAAATAAVGLIGCSTPPCDPKTMTCGTGGGAGGGTGSCFTDDDCPDPRFFLCNTTTSMCEPSCRTANDCTKAVRGEQYALAYCDTVGGLGCVCDEGKCVGSLCGSDADCGAQVCRNGACVAPPAASTVDHCVVVPDYAILKAGAAQKFSVEAFDSSGAPVVLNAGVTWAAGAGGAITGTGNSVTFTAGNAAMAAGDGATATINGKSCSAKVETLDGTVGATEIAVVVTDELTGRAISGATVMASDGAGAPIGSAVMSGANGYAKLTGISATEVNVSVFSTNYNYLTIANYDTSSGASRFLSFVLRRNQNDKYGGQRGTFDGVPATSNVHAGLSGMSIAGSITDLSLSQLLGQTIPTDVKIGSAIDQKGVPLPAGVYIGFSDQQIKTNVSAQGLAGVCTSAKGGETAIAAGTCGTRSGWALSGDVPLGDLPIDAFAGGVDNIQFDVVLARVIPIFRKFNSSIIRDVEFELKTTPLDANGAPTFKDAPVDFFTQKNHPFMPNTTDPSLGSIPLAFNFVNRIPDLPKFRNTFVDGVVLLGGANVAGRGVVPLGLGVAVNTNGDNKTDKPMDLSADGLVQLRMAPTHHGIEGSEYGILAAGVSFKAFTDASAGIAISGIFAHPAENRLKFDPTGAMPLDLPGPFPVMAEGAKFNFSTVASGGLNPRTFRIPNYTVGTSNPTTLVRVAFTDNFEHRWVVIADPSKVGSTGFTLPAPPAGMTDRTLGNGMQTGPRSTMLVQTIRLSETPAAATPPTMAYKQLIEANSTNADRMTDFTTAFSFIDYSRPTVEWKTPMAGGTIAHGATAVVVVNHFKVGTVPGTDDGYVKVAFTGGAGCTEISGMTDTSMGKGEISVTIPTGCMGAGITATARLVDTSGADLVPGVTAPITITVN